MRIRIPKILCTAALALALPALGTCAAVFYSNTTCFYGNWSSPAPVAYGSTESGSTSNTINYNGAPFLITTSWVDGTTGGGGTFIDFYPTVQYIGTKPSINQADVITLDLLAKIAYGSPVDWSGTYSENIPFDIAPGDSAHAQAFVSTTSSKQTIGLFVAGPSYSGSPKSANLGGLIGPTLNYDFKYSFFFYAGTPAGSISSSPGEDPGPSPTPEPAQLIPTALALIAFGGIAFRRRKKQ